MDSHWSRWYSVSRDWKRSPESRGREKRRGPKTELQSTSVFRGQKGDKEPAKGDKRELKGRKGT